MSIDRKPMLHLFIIVEAFLVVFNVASIFAEKNDEGSFIPGDPLAAAILSMNSIDKTFKLPLTVEQMNEQSDSYLVYKAEIEEEGTIIYSTANSGAHRYGPSIMKYEDGTMDAWFSSPGNNSTEWDWIRYRHYDGENWSGERIVLRPTSGSKDRCSVCDPGVVYFNGYYYLAYTSTADSGRKGYNNSAFVARSENPDGPYEKWNGEGWGGYPEPIIKYDGDPNGWGIGEVSFVIRDDDLFIYYTYFDTNGGSTHLAKADLTENWPLTIREKGPVCPFDNNDSLDVVYCDELDSFLAFSIEYRMSEGSRLIVYESDDGKNFSSVTTRKTNIEDYAHNLGISKNTDGHISLSDDLLIGYAFGRYWGRWSTIFQKMELDVEKHSS